MGRSADVLAGCGVGGEHTAAGGGVVHQHVDADGACRVQPFYDSHGGHVKAEWSHEGDGVGGGRRTGFDLGAQVLQQLQQFRTA